MWRGVALRMGIPASCTNAGFLLRKHYNVFIEPYISEILSEQANSLFDTSKKIKKYKQENAAVKEKKQLHFR